MGCKKKLYKCRPREAHAELETQRTTKKTRCEPCDPASLQRALRQMLADKVCGTSVGLWLLVPEHLRLGTWDLLCGWTRQPTECVQPRLALQLVHEAALCTTGVRERRALSQKGFELVNGLPWLASDTSIHHLLAEHTMEDAQRLQVALGKLRRASGHFTGKVLAADPHRTRSYSKRRMRQHRKDNKSSPAKMSQTFFLFDVDVEQPLCLTTATAARTVSQALPELLSMAVEILGPLPEGQVVLVLADKEHFAVAVVDHVHAETPFDLLVPMADTKSLRRQLELIPPEQFTRHWAGYATAQRTYQPRRSQHGPYYQFIQREGERPEDYAYKAFLGTRDLDVASALSREYPKRWHAEVFFNKDQSLGWRRAGTQNLQIRYGQMTMALIAQAVIDQLRKRLGEPYQTWDAKHLAKDLFGGLDGDVRVKRDTIIVTYYHAPDAANLRRQYEDLPAKLESEGVDPRIPWLYNFKLDFRFC